MITILASAFGPLAPMTRGTCYITGPFFVMLAVASLMYGAGVLPLGAQGWLWIGSVLALGTPVLIMLPERIWGRYSKREECC